MKNYLLILLSLVLFLPNLFHIDINPVEQYNHIEVFDPGLSYLNSIDEIENYIDSIAEVRSVAQGSLAYVEIAANILRARFYHSFSHFSLNENWIAAVSGKYIWYDLSCKVQPDPILEHPYAACSQQEIVFMKILRDKHFVYRSVLFPHHYALEVLLHDQWYYFDTNMEPAMNGDQRLSDNWYNSADSLKRYYNSTEFKDLDYKFGVNVPLRYGKQNEIPAPHARLFQSLTAILSKIAWIFPLILLWFIERRQRGSSKKQVTSSE